MNPTLPSGRIPTGASPERQTGRPNDHGWPHPGSGVREGFRRFSGKVAAAVGSPWAFTLAVAAILIWAALGPHYQYSDPWQLVINTGTTIVTFLMVFLIQNTQNRDARAIHLKLDELIRGIKGPRNKLVDLENCTEEELKEIEDEFKRFRERQQTKSQHHQQSENHNAANRAPAARH